MIVSHIQHSSFPVRDLARSRRFYGEILGLEEIDRPNFPFAGAWYRVGNGQVHLIVVEPDADVGAPPRSLNPIGRHTAFAIRDYAKVRDRLRAHGLDILDAGAAMGQMWVADPDGHVIELIATSD